MTLHKRIRPSNTKEAYPEQKLDNDLSQGVVARGSTVFLRGQVAQDLDTGISLHEGDAAKQTKKTMQNIALLLEEPGTTMEAIDCVAARNLLSSSNIPQAMASGLNINPEAHLAERLILDLEADVAAGGETCPVHSAALIVTNKMPFYLVDLRVDWDDRSPVTQLRNYWQAYAPQMQDYLSRAINANAAPSYGVAGNP